MSTASPNSREILTSIYPFLLLFTAIIVNIFVFSEKASEGPNQLALILVSLIVAITDYFNYNVAYVKIKRCFIQALLGAIPTVVILLLVGSLTSMWIISGIVPTMIFYGTKFVSMNIFLPSAMLLCSFFSVATGSSWASSGTIGLTLMSLGKALGFPDALVAGAIVSGSCFGDKMSPLSDSTILAASVVGVDTFTHIRGMFLTTLPAIVISMIVFSLINLRYSPENMTMAHLDFTANLLQAQFNISPYNLMIPIGVLIIIFLRVPAIYSLIFSTIAAAFWAKIYQPQFFFESWPATGTFDCFTLHRLCKTALFGFQINTSDQSLDMLLSRGGLMGMVHPVTLIFSAFLFSSLIGLSGRLEKLAALMRSIFDRPSRLMNFSLLTGITLNTVVADQYLAILLPGRLLKPSYSRNNLQLTNLSRVLEDGATVTAVIVPWNAGGMYHANTLGVSTYSYFPYCIFNLACPIVSWLYTSCNIGIKKRKNIARD